MKYLCLVYSDEDEWHALSESPKNPDEAIQIAGKIPPAPVGSIEARPIRQLVTSRNT